MAPFVPSFLSSFLLLLLAFSSYVQATGFSTVQPSNSSADLSLGFYLLSSQLQLPPNVSVVPLSQSLISANATDLAGVNITGNLVDVGTTGNVLALNSSDIALVSCDNSAYTGNFNGSATVTNILTSQQKPSAILLYSFAGTHCNYTTDDNVTGRSIDVFTLLSPSLAIRIREEINLRQGNESIINIVFNMSSAGGSGDPGTSSVLENSPNTAMIILYSITGIITALFLAIIITGALRAHRHPERYGPRALVGRPRQSRARGIARAMLDTIPIVKFGDNYDPKTEAVKGDVEMGEEDGSDHSAEHRETVTPDETPVPVTSTGALPNNEHSKSEENLEKQTTPVTEPESPTEHQNFSCPICTDDFIKGQDLRVLPCNHQFHPECVDPWLVNVSGTCPLCRIDLNPPRKTETGNEHGEASTEGHTEENPTNEPEGTRSPHNAHSRHHRRLSSYLHGPLNAHRMLDASVEERLAALRSVREEANRNDANANANANEDPVERQRRRSRLTARLRDRFRIRTRTHGDSDATPQT